MVPLPPTSSSSAILPIKTISPLATCCLASVHEWIRSHPSNGNLSPQATCLLFLGFPILSQPPDSGPFLAGLEQTRDGRRERRSCCGKISALPFRGIWTKSWGNRIQDFLSSPLFPFPLFSFFSFIPCWSVVFHVACYMLSLLWPTLL